MTEDLPATLEFGESLRRAERDLESSLPVRTRYLSDKQGTLQELAGSLLDAMKLGPNETIGYLSNPNANVRTTALFLLGDWWPASQVCASRCLTCGLGDSDATVRGVALWALCCLCSQDSDPEGVLRRHIATLLCERLRVPDASVEGLVSDAWIGALQSHLIAVDSLCLIDRGSRDYVNKLAGAARDRMLQSREATEECLDDPDPRLRRAALHLLSSHWKPACKTADRCETILRNDRDPQVRAAALGYLVRFFAKTEDLRIARILARLVRDETEPTPLRELAYHGLYEIMNVPVADWPIIKGSKFPIDADWAFVDSVVSPRSHYRYDE